ncbi:uncharacterized protein L201_002815 [Kwoniella dendrophila CBS 6074]|uniref:Ig-like domain-containing protein n=1 Tax=Kwoniella dendrophila CBS 6074 TaxID=1295534 RepID=A0AAX4JTN3_9TREE
MVLANYIHFKSDLMTRYCANDEGVFTCNITTDTGQEATRSNSFRCRVTSWIGADDSKDHYCPRPDNPDILSALSCSADFTRSYARSLLGDEDSTVQNTDIRLRLI